MMPTAEQIRAARNRLEQEKTALAREEGELASIEQQLAAIVGEHDPNAVLTTWKQDLQNISVQIEKNWEEVKTYGL